MWTDPIVEETRKLRDAYVAEFNYDLDALCRDLKQKEKERGSKTLSTAAQTRA